MSHTDKFSTIQTSYRQRSLMMQLALASGALAQPSLLKQEKITDTFWEDGDGVSARMSMEKVVIGLREYQRHPYQRPPQRASIVWRDGESRILWYAAHSVLRRKQTQTLSVFMIPSMINGAEILDILPEDRSLVRWMTAQGFNVFVFEWGNLREDPELQTLDLALGKKLHKALKWLKSETDSPLIGLGYCMGGLFLAAAEILNPDIFHQLIFIATPWDFKAGAKGHFAEALTGWAQDGLKKLDHLDYMPNEWLQMMFAGVDPAQVVRKFSAFADMKRGGIDEKLFVAVEDWVNGGGDLPSGIIKPAVKDWYLENKVMKGSWRVNGQKIKAQNIAKPSLVIVPMYDKIVPPESAEPLSAQIPDAYILEVDTGHISMMVGAAAERNMWEPMVDWIRAFSQEN